MATKTYGFARPLKYDDVKPGMLLSADNSGRRVIGLAFQGDREILVAVIQHEGEGPPLPYVIDLSDIHQSLTVIDGDRELEPMENADFALLPQQRGLKDGFLIASDGTVGLAVSYNEFGSKAFKILDFATGLDLKHGGHTAALPPARLFIRQDCKEQRRELCLRGTSTQS